MKQLAALALSLSFASVWAQSQQMDIKPIQEAKDEIRSIIKDFKIESMDSAVESPEYRLAQMVMKKIMEEKQDSLEGYLSTVSGRFEKDYAIISNIKLLGDSAATKATVEEAKKRYKTRAEDVTPVYHVEMVDFVISGFDPVIKQCLTVLCVNRVSKDIENWTKIMSKVNINLDLGAGAKLKKSSEIKPKDIQKEWTARATRMNSGLELVMTRGSQEFQRLSDPSITLEEAVAYGSKNIQDFGIDNIRKYSVELIKKHGLALLDQYGAENLTKFTAKQLQTYGADNLRFYGLSLLEKHPLPLLEKLSDDYGIEALTKYGVENLKDFSPSQIDQYGIDLLRKIGVKDLDTLSENNDLEIIRKHGRDLLRFSAEDLDKFGLTLLEKYGSEALRDVNNLEDLKALNAELVTLLTPVKALEIQSLSGIPLIKAVWDVIKVHPGKGKDFLTARLSAFANYKDLTHVYHLDVIFFKDHQISKWVRITEDAKSLKNIEIVTVKKIGHDATVFSEGNHGGGCSRQIPVKLDLNLAGRDIRTLHCPELPGQSYNSSYMHFF